MVNKSLPTASSVPGGKSFGELDRILASGRFGGLANNTKWDELIDEIRSWESWRPSYRTKCINGYVAGWDVEWFYHLPFPFKYTLWFDIGCHQKTDDGHSLDRTSDLVLLVTKIGFEFEVRGDVLRIFSYTPKDYEAF